MPSSVLVLSTLGLCGAQTAYDQQRASLVRSECGASLGGALSLSDKELAADKVLQAAKAAYYDAEVFLPALSFFESAPQIRESKLFELLKPLPKGAALHQHFDSLLETRWFVNVTYEANCYVCWPELGSPVAFRFMSDPNTTGAPACPTGPWRLVAPLRAAAADRAAFDDAIYRAVSLVTASGAPYESVDAAWVKFQGLFGVIDGLLNYLPVYRRYVGAVLDAFASDNLQRLELRAGLLSNITYTLDQRTQSAEAAVQLWLEAAATRNLSLAFVYTALRSQPPHTIGLELARARQLAATLPAGTIVGFDLVGQEE